MGVLLYVVAPSVLFHTMAFYKEAAVHLFMSALMFAGDANCASTVMDIGGPCIGQRIGPYGRTLLYGGRFLTGAALGNLDLFEKLEAASIGACRSDGGWRVLFQKGGWKFGR